METLKEKRRTDPYNYSRCTLMIDGMSIRRQLDYDSKNDKVVGYVDLGSGPLENAAEAREALVVMAVGLLGNWKIPVAYFLTNGINAEVQSQLILTCISSLFDVDIQVVSLVFDGHATNQRTVSMLGGGTRTR